MDTKIQREESEPFQEKSQMSTSHTVRVDTVKGEVYEIKNVKNLSQIKTQLARTLKTQPPTLKLYYNGREITDSKSMNLKAIEAKGNIFVLSTRTHLVDDLLSCLKLKISKMCETYRVSCGNFVRFTMKLERRMSREEQAIQELEKKIAEKNKLKETFAARRQFLEAQEMKNAVDILKNQLIKLKKIRGDGLDKQLVEAKTRTTETFEDLKTEVIEKLGQTEVVVSAYFKNIIAEDKAAIKRLRTRLEVLETDNDAKIKLGIKDLAREIMECEEEMNECAAREEYRAANDAKLRLAFLHKQVKILTDFNFRDALETYATLYSSKKSSAEAPAGVSLNANGEYEIYLTTQTVLRVLEERLVKLQSNSEAILRTLGSISEMVVRIPLPQEESSRSSGSKLLIQRILNASVMLNAKASTTRERKGRNEMLRLKNVSEKSSNRKMAGLLSWQESRDTRTRGSSTKRALEAMAYTTTTPSTSLRSSKNTFSSSFHQYRTTTPSKGDTNKMTTKKLSDSVADLELEVEDIIGMFSPPPPMD